MSRRNNKKILSFFTASMLVCNGPLWSEEIVLECASVKFSDEEWLGNEVVFHINLDTGIIWKNEITDQNKGWIKHKLISDHDLFIKFKECASATCDDNSKDFRGIENYHLLDRVTGSYKRIYQFDGPDYVMFEYDCKPSQKIF